MHQSVKEVVDDGDDGAGRNGSEHHVVIDTNPVMGMRRSIQVVGAIVVNDISRCAIRGWKARTVAPRIRLVTRRPVIVARMETRMTLGVSSIAIAMIVPVISISGAMTMTVGMAVVITMPTALIVARMTTSIVIAIAIVCVCQNRTRQQGHSQGSGKNAFHRLSSRSRINSTVASLSVNSADRCLNDASQVTFRFGAQLLREKS
jgi:hypothetical protein